MFVGATLHGTGKYSEGTGKLGSCIVSPNQYGEYIVVKERVLASTFLRANGSSIYNYNLSCLSITRDDLDPQLHTVSFLTIKENELEDAVIHGYYEWIRPHSVPGHS
tara:strand:- start:125 stop:445 length:321 start_codon:yes stop_codon:yes gene_type:complete